MKLKNLFRHHRPSLQVGVGGRHLSSSLLGRISVGLLFALFGTLTVSAQTFYGIRVGGVDVTSANYTNIKASNGFTAVKGGKVTYDPAANTLTLNNATIQSDEEFGIEVQNDALTIFLIKENTISTQGTSEQPRAALAVSKDATITGYGSLTLTSGYDCGIYIIGTSGKPSTLTIKDCTISAEGMWGISGMTAGTYLVVDGANVSAKGTHTSGSICDLASLTLNNSSITSPSGASWNNSKHAVCNSSGTPITNDWVKITSTVKLYAIYEEIGNILTFYYDDQFNSRDYTTRYEFPQDMSSPDWKWKSNTLIKKVNFHASFANYHCLTNLSYLFFGCSNLAEFYNLQNLNTENVTDMSDMFYGCKMETINLSYFNTSKVEKMYYMFGNCSALTSLNVNSFDTQNVTDMRYMFSGCTSLKTIYCDNDWNKTGLYSQEMFKDCSRLPNFDSSKTDATMANPTTGYFKAKEPYAVKFMGKLTFYYDNERVNRDGTKYDMPTNTIPAWTTLNDAVTDITSVDFDESFDNYHGLTSTFSMFRWLTNLTTIDHLERLHTENVTEMGAMFYQCQNLQYLNMAQLNTSNVTTMHDMFFNCRSMSDIVFGGVTNFDTGKVKSMEGMFAHCEGLTGIDVNNFDVGNVTNMASMFSECSNLETILCDNDWKALSKVTNSANMFYGCDKLASGSSGMSYDPRYLTVDYANPTTGYFQSRAPYAVLSGSTLTFRYDQNMTVGDPNYFSVPLDGSTPGWANNEAITTVNFDNSFNQYHGLTSTKRMFQGLSNLTTINNISRLHTENVTNMNAMFQDCSSLTSIDLSSFNTENVTIMSSMFFGCSGLTTLNLSGWNTANVTNIASMFRDCSSLTSLDLSNFNTGSVTGMNATFRGCSGLTTLNLSGWNTANVTDMLNMFSGCSSLTYLDLSSFNTANVTKMSYMFNNCSNLVTIYVGMEWSIAGLTDSGNDMFLGCTSLVGDLGTTYDANHVSMEYAHKDAGSVLPGYLSWASAYAVLSTDSKTLSFYYDKLKETREGTKYSLRWTSTELPGWTDASNGNQNITTVYIDPSMADYHALEIAKGMFFNLGLLRTINGLEYLDTRNVTDMSNMFTLCQKLTTLDLTHFNVGKVTDMHHMFSYCYNLTTIYCNDNWWKSDIVSHDMFYNCENLVGAISYDANKTDVNYANPNTGYFTAMVDPELEAYAVYTADNTTLTFYYDNLRDTRDGTDFDLNEDYHEDAGWQEDIDTEDVTTVVFDPSFVNARPTTTYSWFYGMTNLTTITGMENLNTSEVFDMAYMFQNCYALTTLDLSNFNTSKVTDMEGMFDNCTGLTTIYVGDGWSTTNVTSSSDMFTGCTALVGGNGTPYNADHVDKAYAHIDVDGDPGYFTETPPYAVVSTDGKTLTFYHDGQKGQRQGTKYNVPNGLYAPDWFFDNVSPNIETVIFDPSFAGVRTNYTYCWFKEMGKLSTITGLEYLNTSEVTSMQQMFYGCGSLTSLDLSGFDTKNVTDMASMFAFCGSLVTITVSSKWSTSNVTVDNDMFESCSSLVGGAGTTYNDANPKDKTYARIDATGTPGYFTGSSTLPDGEAYAVYTEDNTTLTFYYDNLRDTRTGTTYDLNTGSNEPDWLSEGWNASVTNVVFDPSFATARPTTTYRWFRDMTNLTTITGIEYLNTSEVTSMYGMFWGCSSLESLDLSSFNTQNVTHMGLMFYDCSSLTSLDLSSFNTAKVTFMWGMFNCCRSLESLNVSSFNTANVTNMSGMFRDCSALTTLDLSSFNTAKVTNMDAMFTYCKLLTSLYLNRSRFVTANVTDMRDMFYNCSSLTTLDLSNFNTQKVTNMRAMFRGCQALTTLDLSSFNTANVTDMSFMFDGCSSLTTLDLSSFNTEKVTDMEGMFSWCPALTTIYVGTGWNTDAVTNSDYMFYWSSNLVGGNGTTYDSNHVDAEYAHVDVVGDPGYFTAIPYVVLSTDGKTLTFYHDGYYNKEGTAYNLIDWSLREEGIGTAVTTAVFDPSFADARPIYTVAWFYNMANLTTITGMEYLNTSEVTNMSGMFYNCYSLTSLDLSSFNTSNVTDMSYMFCECSNLTSLDLSRFNTAKVTDMKYMFCWCEALTTIYVSEGWSTAPGVESDYMFAACTALKGGNGTKFNSNHIDKEYARIDGGATRPGYFTYKASFMLGDVNGDNKVDVADITALTNHLLGIEGAYNSIAADVDGNGEVTSADVPVLVSKILGK